MNYTKTHTVGGQCPSIFRRLTGWLLASIGFVALAAAANAQTATITGRIMNQTTGEYLKYAQVQVVGTDKSAISENEGVYTLTNVPAGEVKLSVTYTGLDLQEITVVVPASGSVKQDVSMTNASLGDVITLGAFKVATAREGNAKAIVEQRQAMNLKTVISADAFGDVSEGNVGEFLRLLPGVTVDYVDNDVRTTRIRGLPAKYSNTTMDGHGIATAASASITTGRQFELEQVSLTSLDTIEVAKSPTPDMATAGLAGNTNIISKTAFNQKGRSIKYLANVSMNSWFLNAGKTKGWDNQNHYKFFPGGNIEWVDTLMGGRLGIVLSAGHTGSFAEQRAVTGSTAWDRNPNNNSVEVPLTTQIAVQDGPKVTFRDTMLLNLQFKVTDDLKLALNTSYGYYRAEFYNRQWSVNANTTSMLTSTTATTIYPDALDGTLSESYFKPGVSRTPTKANYLSVAANNTATYASIYGSNQRKSGGTFVVSPSASWKMDDLKVDFNTSYSQSKSAYTSGQDGFFSQVTVNMPGVSWQYDKGGDRNYHIYQTYSGATSNQGSIFDIANYNSNGVANRERRNGKDQMWTANLNVELDRNNWNIPVKFKAGLATSLNVFDIANSLPTWNFSLAGGPVVAGTVGAINLRDYIDPLLPSIGSGFRITDWYGVTGNAPSIDKWKLYQKFLANGNTDSYSLVSNGEFKANAAGNLRYDLQNQFDITEKQQAAFIMATIKPLKKLSVVTGLRFERTETTGKSFDDKGTNATLMTILGYTDAQVQALTPAQKATYTSGMDYIYYRYGSRVARTKDYDNVLPSLQARYEVQKNLLIRSAYYKSLLRPDFQNVTGGVALVEDSAIVNKYTFQLKNTELRPETADNFDASVEYYFEPVGTFSLTGFYKKIKDIQINSSALIDFNNLPQALIDLGINPGFATTDSLVSTVVNGPKTSLWGMEVAYSQELTFLPTLFKGFGVTANYTYIAPKDARIWAMIPSPGDGLSKNAFNFIVRYKLKKFNAQFTSTWASRKILSVGGLTLNPDGTLQPANSLGVLSANNNVYTYIRDRWQFNLNMNYQLKKYATLFINLNNVLNEPQYRYTEQEYYTNRHGQYGMGITAGVKGAF